MTHLGVARLSVLLLGVAGTGRAAFALALPWLEAATTTDAGDIAGLGFAPLVGAGCALALLGCWSWLALGTVVVAARALAGGASRTGLRWVPAAVRTLVPLLLGATVTAAPAHAGTEAIPARGCAVGTTTGAAAALPLPDRVLTDRPVRGRTVVVRPGDTLWAITSRLLPDAAPVAAIDRGWRRIADANAVRLPDPDLLHPGTRLRVPAATTHPREDPR